MEGGNKDPPVNSGSQNASATVPSNSPSANANQNTHNLGNRGNAGAQHGHEESPRANNTSSRHHHHHHRRTRERDRDRDASSNRSSSTSNTPGTSSTSVSTASSTSGNSDRDQSSSPSNDLVNKAKRSGANNSNNSGSPSSASSSVTSLTSSPLSNSSSSAANNAPDQSHNHPKPLPQQPEQQVNQAPYNWQSTKVTVKDRLTFVFNSEVMSDVHFIVGKGMNVQRVPAHKFVLSVGSAVFDAMFNGGMATKAAEVELPDVEPAAFLALLRFLYSDEVQIGPETVMTTLYTAKKYAVPALERACVDFLKRNLSADNAFMLLTQARLFDEPQLAALCLETIDKNTSEALGAEGFTDIDLETLCVVLERDTLGIRECKLFSALCRWAEAESIRQNLPVTPENQRQSLGRSLSLVRFPLMTVEEFAGSAAQTGILSDKEVVELFLYFTVNPKPSVNFLDVPRCCLTGKEQVVSRFCQIESRWGYSGTSDRIRFMVNRRIFVVGFGLYGSIHGPTEYAVTIQIIQDNGKVSGSNDTSFQCDGSNATFRVMFKEPIEILPNINYTACATLKGPDSYYGTKGLRKVTHESVSSGKVTFQFTYAAGNNNGTSVEDGQLPEIIFYT